ncbi:hypothetical protein [Methanosarcina horonobensis]|uniref:hypothetical protein n=1 Tax=Methanosarcina horonobensis TaxID=418008 RepID=UPI000A69B3A5|nr:hypothetical protein [Methanosarcina horonobensis]
MSYAQTRRLSNIDIIPQTWQAVDIATYAKNYDLTICCHALWQFPDILPQIRRMEAVSRGYCCLAHGFEASPEGRELTDTSGLIPVALTSSLLYSTFLIILEYARILM